MGDDHLAHRLRRLIEDLRHFRQPAQRDAAILERPVEGGVDPHHQQAVAAKHRFELGREVPPVGAERRQRTLPKPVHRHVVVARHHQRRR
jgi:hypothetical protein